MSQQHPADAKPSNVRRKQWLAGLGVGGHRHESIVEHGVEGVRAHRCHQVRGPGDHGEPGLGSPTTKRRLVQPQLVAALGFRITN